MKVLFISHFYEPHIGGVERHVKEISERLVLRGFQVNIITEKIDSALPDKERINGVIVKRISFPKIKYFGLFFVWLSLLKNINILKKADLIHIHDVFIWYLPFCFIFPKKPTFITFHGYSSYPLTGSALIFQKIAERFTKGNICIGDFIKKWFGTKSTIISYGAVDLRKFRPSYITKFKYDAIFSGRLDEQTGILTYLEAIKFIKSMGFDFKLLVLGDGKYKKKTDKIAITKGFIDKSFIYFKKSRFAFVSRYLAILEAFACKKLVFAVYDNPLKEDYLKVAPFAKWIIIEKNPNKLAKKILYYRKNSKEVKTRVENAYRWVQEQTWEKMMGDYLRLWGIKQNKL